MDIKVDRDRAQRKAGIIKDICLAEIQGVHPSEINARINDIFEDVYATSRECYTVFKIPKKRGGTRTIESPDEKTKRALQKLIKHLTLPMSEYTHGFRSDKNIYTMAMHHTNKAAVGCIDLKNFFPSVTYPKVARIILGWTTTDIFKRLHLCRAILPCFTAFSDDEVCRLPQGSPASPMLSNIALYTLDNTLVKLCNDASLNYSRYADDIAISGDNVGVIKRYIFYVFPDIVEGMEYDVNPKKSRVMLSTSRQMVCGLVVNKKVNIPRRWRKRLRAEVFQQRGHDLRQDTKGRLNFVNMIYNPKDVFKETISNITVRDAKAAMMGLSYV